MPSVLFITLFSPLPVIDGGRRLTLELLRTYALYCEVDLLTFYDSTEIEVPGLLKKHLGQMCRRIAAVPSNLIFKRHRFSNYIQFLQSFFGPGSFHLRKFWHPQMAKTVSKWLASEKYGLIHFDYLASLQYLSSVRDCPVRKICMIDNFRWEAFNELAKTARNPLMRLFMRREAVRLKACEMKGLRKMDAILLLAEPDIAYLRQEGITQPIYVYRMPTATPPKPITTFEDAEATIISLGRIESWREQGLLWFYHNVWPLVLKRLPDIHWHIIGADAPPSIEVLHNGQNIFVEGFVEDLTPFLKKTRACIVPLFLTGRSTRSKILDMQSLGIPCVANRASAHGLENEGVWIADEPEDFAEGIVRLVTEPALWHRMSEVGRAFVLQNFAPEQVAEEFKQILSQMLRFPVIRRQT